MKWLKKELVWGLNICIEVFVRYFVRIVGYRPTFIQPKPFRVIYWNVITGRIKVYIKLKGLWSSSTVTSGEHHTQLWNNAEIHC